MEPRAAPLINGRGRWRDPGRIVCHCVLIETARDLILVDAGIGARDIEDPARLGALFLNVARPRLDLAQTAAKQIARLGYSPADVGHIVLTHLDVDHAGGLSDFPNAQVHVYEAEHAAAMNPQTLRERHRYRAVQWEHGVDWAVHGDTGERWRGFGGVRLLSERTAEVLLVPLAGHSRGHAGVAILGPDGWMLHCGDAYFHHDETHSRGRTGPLGLALFRNVVAMDNRLRRANVARLRALAATSHDLTLFSAHDPDEFDPLAG